MIILEEPPESQAKFDTYLGPTLRHPDRAACRSPSLLPDYDASEAQHKRIVKPTPGRLFDSRFWRAALYSLIIYIILTAVVGIPLVVLKSRDNDDSQYSSGSTSSLWASVGSIDLPPSLNLANGGNYTIGANSTCNNWTMSELSSWPHYASQSRFSLEPSGLITIRSNVSYDANQETGINGSLSVAYNTDHKATEVVFKVQLRASSIDLRKQVNVCFTDVGDNRGLSIYVPNSLAPTDSLLFTVSVLLPQLPSSKRIDSLVTYLPMFSQKFGDLRQFLQFGQITIEGTFYDIECSHLLAPYISVKNVLASITGSFNVTDALTLDTIKGPIEANVTLVRLTSATKPTYLTLDTGYSYINTSVTLVGSTSSKTLFSLPYPSFVSDVRTFSGPIALDVFHDKSSPSMPFQLHVQNNLAQTNVSLDSKFQGSFSAQTKLATVTVWKGYEDPAADPTGEGKPRTIQYDQNSTTNVNGWIGWGKRPRNQAALSYVEVVSSLSPVTLALGCKHS